MADLTSFLNLARAQSPIEGSKAYRALIRRILYKRKNADQRESQIKVNATQTLNWKDGYKENWSKLLMPVFECVNRIRKSIGVLLFNQISAAISETGTREWDKTDNPPTTITLTTLRTSAGIFNRVGSFA